ncbi:MAG: FecR domain-containing protein [Verrucomicrobiota bacterium]|nr:FecR domain-containing protein [Verrucomicrobiota bacterium]
MKKAFQLTFLLLAIAGYSADKIGKMIAVEGGVKAIQGEEERPLTKHSDVYVGDLLVTDATGKGEVEFNDGTMILLIPDSQYSVEAYTESHTQNRYLAKLYQGGVRLSTGMIAKKNPENFELNTPNATIGVRGTLFETRMMDGNLYVGSSSGNVSVNNPGGGVTLESNQYASVSSSNATPQPVAERPSALDLSNFAVPAGGIALTAGTIIGTATMASTQAATANSFAWGPAAVGLSMVATVVATVVTLASQSGPAGTSHTHTH